ncbi:MAG: nucleotidyltransferase family protein [Lachnospiraceae bacterium]|nr:nucleotidyltransferase family protein [Lachnospiraceae bacterium]
MEESKRKLTTAQVRFLNLMKAWFLQEEEGVFSEFSDAEIGGVVAIAREQGLLGFVYAYLYTYHRNRVSTKWLDALQREIKPLITNNYSLWQQTIHLFRKIHEAKLPCLLLKGPAIANYYSIPELRKSGDVDLWMYQPDTPAARGEVYYGQDFITLNELLKADGYVTNPSQHANHHIGYLKDGCGEVEAHALWMEDFHKHWVNEEIASYAQSAYQRAMELELFPGEHIKTLAPGDLALQMLLHMLQHYLTQGFGWKFLCDWTAIWNHPDTMAAIEEVKQKVRDWHLETFVSYCCWISNKYLGMKDAPAQALLLREVREDIAMELMSEMFAAGEFGDGEEGRMVAPEGKGVLGLVMEFHHQMRRNHYEASKSYWKWPYLWVVTLVEFIRNNHAIRNTSTRQIIANARRRGKLRRQMQLFKEDGQ